jgi:DNA ligase 1
MSLLATLVATSQRVAAIRSRTDKIGELAACIRELLPVEVGIGVAYLPGEVRQAKLGFGGATPREVSTTSPTIESMLHILEVDAALEQIAQCLDMIRALHAAQQNLVWRSAVGDLRQRSMGIRSFA